MSLQELFEPGTMHIAGAVITGLISLQTVFLKWLIDSFKGLRTDLNAQAHQTQTWLRDHEEKDQTRHEENLNRFEKIGIALARLGAIQTQYAQEEDYRPIRSKRTKASTS